jgi:hypothetical protein
MYSGSQPSSLDFRRPTHGFIVAERCLLLLLLFACVLASYSARAADYYARTAGAAPITNNWNQNTTWTTSNTCNGAALAAGVFPGAGDNVFICNNKTVTVNITGAQAGSVTILAGANTTALNLGGAGTSLTVTNSSGQSGNVIINGSTANATRTIAVGARSLDVTGNVTINGGTTTGGGNNTAQLTVAAGTVTIGGNLALNAGTVANNRAQTMLTGTGRIDVAGNVTLTGGITNNNRDALLNVSGISALGQGINIGGTLNVVSTLATTATVSITSAGGRITVNGAGGVSNGDTLTVGAGIFRVTNAGATFTTSNAAIASSTTVAANGQLIIAGHAAVTGGSTASSAASMAGTAGTITIGGNATVTGGAFNPSGATLSVTTGTLGITGNATVTGGSGGASVATLTVGAGAITVGGNLSVTPGSNAGGDATASVTGAGKMDVAGNVTLTGGSTNGHDALLTVGGASAAGQGINIGGTLNVNATISGSSTVSITVALGRITVNGVGGVNNGDVVSVGAGVFTVSGGPFATVGTNNAASTSVTSGTLDVTGLATVTGGAGANRTATLTVSTGTVQITGNLQVTPGANDTGDATASVTGAGKMDISGNVTLTGGANANRDALLRVSSASAAGQGINIGGTLNINATVAGSATADITVAGGRITVNGAGGVNNGDTVAVGAGIFTLSNAASTFTNSNPSIVANTTVSTGSLDAAGAFSNAAGETVQITTTGAITVGGTFTNSGTFTFSAAGFLTLRGATSTVNGTFNRGTGTVTMNGSAGQNLSGSAITGPAVGVSLHNFTVNNTGGVTLGNNVRAANTITFTSGNVSTGSNALIAGLSCANAANVSRTSGHVEGNFQKTIPAGASTCVFEVGSNANYTPAVLLFVAGTGAGSITARTTGVIHPQNAHASSGINAAASLNRYWTLTNGGVTFPVAGFSATFNFINGTPVDVAGGTPANFIVERWTGAAWTSTTLNAGCAPTPGTNLCVRVNGLTAAAGFGDFWAGGAKVVVPPAPDSFNAVEVGAAITGRIFTKLRGAGFTLDIVAVQGGALYGTFGAAVDADLMANAAAGNCAGGTPIGSTSQNVNLTSGRGTTGAFNVATAYPNVRVRIQYPAGGPYTITTCSSDNFSIKPTAFSITSSDATNLTTSGGTPIKTGAIFNLTAAGGAGYTGTPSTNFTGNVTGTPNAGTIGGSFSAGVGTAIGDFYYSEVGHFGLNTDAVRDAAFTATSGDPAGGDCIAGSTSDTLSGGQYGCLIGSTAVAPMTGLGFGRFIPDNFNVSYNTPSFGNAAGCGVFTYVGRIFTFSTVPEMTVTARNGTANGLTNATTRNYAGSYVKLTTATLNQLPYGDQIARYIRFDALGGGATPDLDRAGLPNTSSDPAVGTFKDGVGILTFGAGTGLSFTRNSTTPNAQFNADIALRLNVIDGDNVAFAGNPASFGAATATNGIAFTGGKAMRYGRLRLDSASGSSLTSLAMPMETQYWNGSSFVTNADDGCTSLGVASIGLGNYTGSLNAGETTPTLSGGNFSNGRNTLTLSAPGATNGGSVDVVLNLGTSTTIDTCATWSPSTPTPTAGNLAHLRGRWCGGTYTKDPTARARFGVFRGSEEVIHLRENFLGP